MQLREGVGEKNREICLNGVGFIIYFVIFSLNEVSNLKFFMYTIPHLAKTQPYQPSQTPYPAALPTWTSSPSSFSIKPTTHHHQTPANPALTWTSHLNFKIDPKPHCRTPYTTEQALPNLLPAWSFILNLISWLKTHQIPNPRSNPAGRTFSLPQTVQLNIIPAVIPF